MARPESGTRSRKVTERSPVAPTIQLQCHVRSTFQAQTAQTAATLPFRNAVCDRNTSIASFESIGKGILAGEIEEVMPARIQRLQKENVQTLALTLKSNTHQYPSAPLQTTGAKPKSGGFTRTRLGDALARLGPVSDFRRVMPAATLAAVANAPRREALRF